MSVLRRVVILIPAVLAWFLFFYWWRRVALQSTPAEAQFAIFVLIIVAVCIFFGMLGWVRHNLKLALRGKRGFATRYLRPAFTRDWLDRTLVFRATLPLRGRWFIIPADRGEKLYAPQAIVSEPTPPLAA